MKESSCKTLFSECSSYYVDSKRGYFCIYCDKPMEVPLSQQLMQAIHLYVEDRLSEGRGHDMRSYGSTGAGRLEAVLKKILKEA